MDIIDKIFNTDAYLGLGAIPSNSVDCAVTSPPYYHMRDYQGVVPTIWKDGMICCLGAEDSVELYVTHLCDFFDEVYRVLKPTGTFFLNIADTYLGSGKGVWKDRTKAKKESFQFQAKPKEQLGGWKKPKQLAMIPARVAIEMQNRGWILRNQLIWHRPNQLPQSARDRFTNDYELLYFFTKRAKYYFKQQLEPFSNNSKPGEIYTGQATKDYAKEGAQNPSDTKRRILESMRKRGGRNKRAVWSIKTRKGKGSHTASYPEELVETPIKAGCPEGGLVLDPFLGTGTTAAVAKRLGRHYLGFEISQEYLNIINDRLGIKTEETLCRMS
jgi:site-specific DNA-methyltransferase (cytosine-N4-specific)